MKIFLFQGQRGEVGEGGEKGDRRAGGPVEGIGRAEPEKGEQGAQNRCCCLRATSIR